MILKCRGKAALNNYLLLFFSLFSVSALFNFGMFGWHDQQRVAQLMFLIVILWLAFMLVRKALSGFFIFVVVTIFCLGLISSFYSTLPAWALKEWARYLGLAILVILVGSQASRKQFRMAVVFCMCLVAAVQVFQFLALYFSAFASGLKLLHASILLNGFSNPRFFGQFQILLLPVLGYLVCYLFVHRRIKAAVLLAMILILQWCIAYMLGGRGLWLAALLSHGALLVFCGKFWRLVAVQALAALLGLGLFAILFIGIPHWLDLAPSLYDGLRTDLSSREVIWREAWKMAVAHPWLGVGPMHFAATYNPVAAHPHQMLLQWLAEWGAPATILATLLIGRGMLAGIRVLRSDEADYEDAGLWVALAGALLLAQVDGVFVMPYTETWLAVLAGLAVARWSRPVLANTGQRFVLALMAIPVVLVLGHVLIKEVATLPATEQAYQERHPVGWSPRFWEQGWIPMAD